MRNESLKTKIAVMGILLSLTTASSHAAVTRTLNENSANKTYSIKVGATFHLVLHSMYWTLNPLPSKSAVKTVGDPVGSAAPIGPGRPPGTGQGSLDWTLKAVRVGILTLQATRTSCGEALMCSPDQSKFAVKIKVIK